jgi:hypothetical protein
LVANWWWQRAVQLLSRAAARGLLQKQAATHFAPFSKGSLLSCAQRKVQSQFFCSWGKRVTCSKGWFQHILLALQKEGSFLNCARREVQSQFLLFTKKRSAQLAAKASFNKVCFLFARKEAFMAAPGAKFSPNFAFSKEACNLQQRQALTRFAPPSKRKGSFLNCAKRKFPPQFCSLQTEACSLLQKQALTSFASTLKREGAS